MLAFEGTDLPEAIILRSAYGVGGLLRSITLTLLAISSVPFLSPLTTEVSESIGGGFRLDIMTIVVNGRS